jgi:hypothetical protein
VVLWDLIGEMVVLWDLIGEMVVLWDLIGEMVVLWAFRDLDGNCWLAPGSSPNGAAANCRNQVDVTLGLRSSMSRSRMETDGVARLPTAAEMRETRFTVGGDDHGVARPCARSYSSWGRRRSWGGNSEIRGFIDLLLRTRASWSSMR